MDAYASAVRNPNTEHVRSARLVQMARLVEAKVEYWGIMIRVVLLCVEIFLQESTGCYRL